MVDLSRAERFKINLDEHELVDLNDRLVHTRYPDLPDSDDDAYGVSQSYLQELITYWAEKFDWRAYEARLNEYDHYRVNVGGEEIHFMYKPGVGPNPTPVILTHGWPWTFWHWSKVVDELADPGSHGGDPLDAFDVIIPSYPGFGFSSPSVRGDLNYWKIADIWHELMADVLGLERYAAGGGDFGALVTAQLGHKYADSVIGIHVSTPTPLDIFQGERWWDITEGRVSPPEATELERDGLQRYMKKFVAHIAVHMLDSQTLSFGLSDSPAGLLAWIVRRYQLWTHHDGDLESVFSKDDLLAIATMFWVTNTIGSSIRTYVNTAKYPWTPSHDRSPVVEVPAGITFMGFENPPGVSGEQRVKAYVDASSKRSPSDRSASWYNLVNVKAHDQGGHFAPWENPQAWITDMRDTIRAAKEGISLL